MGVYNLGAVTRELRASLTISCPMIISQLVYALNGFIATIFIAHLGKDELATHALVWGVFITLLLFIIGILSAVSVLVAQRNGAGDHKGIQQIFAHGMVLALLSAIPVTLLLYFGAHILALFGQSAVTVKLSDSYFHSLAYAILPVNILVTIQQFLLGMGRTKFVLFIGVMEVPMQLLLFYIFIFGKFGFPAYGLSGIGIGITAVVALWAIIMLTYLQFATRYKEYKIFAHLLHVGKYYLVELLKVGVPLGFMYCIEVALFAACAFLIGTWSSDMLAAHQIAYQCFVFAIVIIFGFSQGATIRVSYEVGRQDIRKVWLTYYVHLAVCFLFTLLCVVLYFLLAKQIINLDIGTKVVAYSNVVKYAETFLRIVCVLLLIESLRGVLIGAMRGLKQTKTTMYVSMLTYWVIAFPVAYLLGVGLSLYGAGIWWGITIGVAVATVILWFKLTKFLRQVDLASLHI